MAAKSGTGEMVLAATAKKEIPLYSAMFHALGFSPEKQEELMRLIEARRKAKVDNMVTFARKGTWDRDAVHETHSKIEADEKRINDEILQKLDTDENRQRYQRWEQTLGERKRISYAEEQLGKQFDTRQVEAAVDAMYPYRRDLGELLKKDDQAKRERVFLGIKGAVRGALSDDEVSLLMKIATTRAPSLLQKNEENIRRQSQPP